MEGLRMTPTAMAMMQARSKYRHIPRRCIPELSVAIEYEDDDYTYMSSFYLHQYIKADIEHIKQPITIHYSAWLNA